MTNYRQGTDASRVCTPEEVRNLGCDFVMRYFSHFPSKNLTEVEAANHSNAGIDIVSIFEDDINDFEKGFDGGVANAKLAVAQGAAVLMPQARPWYFAVDENVDPGNGALHEYFRGIVSQIGLSRVGCYGSTAVLRTLYAAGLINWRFRSMSTGWFGGSGSDTDFNIEQNGWFNPDFDRDAAITYDFGQWRQGWIPNNGVATVSLSIVDMCAREDPHRAPNLTTNFNNVYPVQRALAAEGMYGARQWTPGNWGQSTISAYANWQGTMGFRGTNADGIPGMKTLVALGNKHNFKVVA